MAQETIITDRVRYPSGVSRRSQRSREYKLASQNLWAKALSVVGVGILLLLCYAIFPEMPLIVVGVCTIFLGLCTLIADRIINNKCKKGRQQRRDGERNGTRGRNLSQSATNQDLGNATSNDIWTCPVPLEWPIPPSTPPPTYTPTNPVPLDENIELGPPPFEPHPALGLPPPLPPLTPPPPLTPLPSRENDHEVCISSDSDEGEDDDAVTELPIMFPLRTRRRCISTPPLPSYEEVIEEDRRTVASASSMPSLLSRDSASPSSSSSADQSQSSGGDTAVRLQNNLASEEASSNTSSSSSDTLSILAQASRIRASSLPVRT